MLSHFIHILNEMSSFILKESKRNTLKKISVAVPIPCILNSDIESFFILRGMDTFVGEATLLKHLASPFAIRVYSYRIGYYGVNSFFFFFINLFFQRNSVCRKGKRKAEKLFSCRNGWKNLPSIFIPRKKRYI